MRKNTHTTSSRSQFAKFPLAKVFMQVIFFAIFVLAIANSIFLIIMWIGGKNNGLAPIWTLQISMITNLMCIGFMLIVIIVNRKGRSITERNMNLFIVFLLVVFCYTNVVTTGRWRNRNNLLKNGNEVSGEILHLHTAFRGRSYEHYIKYRFTVFNSKTGEKDTFVKEQEVNPDMYNLFQVGSTVHVLFDPNYPENAIMKNDSTLLETTFVTGLINAAILLFLFPLFAIDPLERLFSKRFDFLR